MNGQEYMYNEQNWADNHVASLTAAQQHCQTTSWGPLRTTPFSLHGVRHFQTASAGAGLE